MVESGEVIYGCAGFLESMPVIVDATLTEREYPTNRFIEYEASDHWWLDKYGFSRTVPMKGYYRVGYTLVMHPAMLERIKKYIRSQ